MRSPRWSRTPAAAPAKEAVIIFRVGPHRLGIPASTLREIRNDRGLHPSEFGCSGTVSLHDLFGVRAARTTHLLVLRQDSRALSVDDVEQIIEIGSVARLPHAFQGAERNWFRGLVLHGECVVPVIDPAGLLGTAPCVSFSDAVAQEALSA